MKLTPSRQRNAVSEGFALGLLRNGHDKLPVNKPSTDLAFNHAWRSWEHSHLYGQISTDLRNGSDGTYVIAHARKNHGVIHFYWEIDQWPYSIVARHGIDSEDELDGIAESIDGGLPLSAWKSLARHFLDRVEGK